MSLSSSASRSFKNPYNTGSRGSDHDSLESLLQTLIAATSTESKVHSYSTQQWTQLHTKLREKSEEWNLSNARIFLEWVYAQVERRKNDDHGARSIFLLSTVLNENWDERLVYAVSVPKHNQPSPFFIVGRCAKDTSRPTVQSAACACLASIWRSLSMIDSLTTSTFTHRGYPSVQVQDDNAWWMASLEDQIKDGELAGSYWYPVFQWALDQWLRNDAVEDGYSGRQEKDTPNGFLEKETLRCVACILLVNFFRDDSTSKWFYSMSDAIWLTLMESLIEQSQRLLDPNMPMTSFARLSLGSLNLLAVMERKAGREMPPAYQLLLDGNGGLVTVMMQSILGLSTDTLHRWAKDGTEWILPILSEWSKSGTLMSFWEMDSRTEIARIFCKDVTATIQNRSIVKSARLSAFLWLLRETPALCQNVINEVVSREKQVDFILSFLSLFLDDNSNKSTEHACALHQLIRLIPESHTEADDFRKNSKILQRLISRTLHALDSQEDAPLLLLLLDVLGALLTKHVIASQILALDGLIEKLCCTLSLHKNHKNIRDSKLVDTDSSMDSLESTPPAHNLSRMDESRVTIDDTDNIPTVSIVYGLEPCLRMSSAALLAQVAESENGGENTVVTMNISKVIADFVESDDVSLPPRFHRLVPGNTSLRRALLFQYLAVMAAEKNLFASAFANFSSQMSSHYRGLASENLHLENRITWLEQREKQLTEHNCGLESQLHAQNATALRERNAIHRKIVMECEQTLAAEIAKRVELQRELDELRTTARDLQSQLHAIQSENKTLRDAEKTLQNDLFSKSKSLEQLQKETKQVAQDREKDRDYLARLSEEVEAATQALSCYEKREREFKDRIVRSEEDLEALEASRAEMHANLETLFGDMVSLAHAYELKENEVSSGQQSKEATIQKLEKDLDKERQRRKDLEDKFRQVEYENEALSRKYARAREKLEEERKQKSQAQASQASARRVEGSKSYIQQLQLSTSRTTTNSKRANGKENVSESSSGRVNKIR